MSDVFVSYKAEDRRRVAPLVEALEADGFSVWWDAHIGSGTNWRQDIEEHLDAAKCVIVVWTKRSVGPEGAFVRDEATRAQRRGAYLPIRLDPVEPPLGFGEVQALLLKGWKGDRADPRFREVVDAVRSRIAGEHFTHAPSPLVEGRVSRRAVMAGGVGVVALTAAGGGWLLLKPTPANAKRIAVLPFANLSGDEKQSYFSEGVAEELRAALSRIHFEVIGRTSCEAVKGLDARAAASKLGVANILTGSVRRSPEQIRINAQLVRGSDGVERWAENYDRAPGDAIKIQSDIAANVAQALRVALGQATRAALTLGGTLDSVAQDLQLRAKNLYYEGDSPEDIRQAIGLVSAAIARDSNYADAYYGRAIMLEFLSTHWPESSADQIEKLAQAEADAWRAMAIAPKLGTPHSALAAIALDRLNFKLSYQHTRQALALSPDNTRVVGNASRMLSTFGDEHEALRLSHRLVELDPLATNTYITRASILLQLRKYPQSIDAAQKALELAPGLRDGYVTIAICFTMMNEPAQAKAAFEKLPAEEPLRTFLSGVAAARSGDVAGAERSIAHIRQLYGALYSYQYADIYAQLGIKERAFAELENAVEAKDSGLSEMKVDPFLDPIRGDPRYAALVKKLNFP